MEFGLSSESEVFSYLRKRVPKQHATLAPRAVDGFFTGNRPHIVLDTPAVDSNEAVYRQASDLSRQKISSDVHISDSTSLDVDYSSSRVQELEVTGDPKRNLLSSLTHHIKKVRNIKLNLSRLKHMTRTQAIMYAAATILFIGGLGISVDGWRTNVAVHAQVNQLNKSAAPEQASSETPVAVSGAGESQQAQSGGSSAPYTVAPDLPKYIKIPSIRVNAKVISVGTLADGSIGTPPPNTNQAGWFNVSSKPGQAGAMIIDGHVAGYNTTGVFYNLKKLNPGDKVEIEKGDGQIISYVVAKIMTYDANNVDMNAVANPVDFSKPGLNLITCAGKYDNKSATFDQRTVVFTVQM